MRGDRAGCARAGARTGLQGQGRRERFRAFQPAAPQARAGGEPARSRRVAAGKFPLCDSVCPSLKRSGGRGRLLAALRVPAVSRASAVCQARC